MGTWAVDAFGNDDAADWLYGLEDVDDLSLVESTLDEVVSADDSDLDADIAANALAACEVIARMLGNWGEKSEHSAAADEWVEKTKLPPSTQLVSKAHDAIRHILAERSELRQLWQDSEDYAAWIAAVDELKRRLHHKVGNS